MKNSVVTPIDDARSLSPVESALTILDSIMHVAHETSRIITQCSEDINKGVMSWLHDVTITQFILQQYESP
jgi:hypothetical protein